MHRKVDQLMVRTYLLLLEWNNCEAVKKPRKGVLCARSITQQLSRFVSLSLETHIFRIVPSRNAFYRLKTLTESVCIAYIHRAASVLLVVKFRLCYIEVNMVVLQ